MRLGRLTVLAVGAAVFVLAGIAPARAGTLERIRERGKLVLGNRADERPFSYEEGGKAAGYSIALCQEVAAAIQAELGLAQLPVEYVQVSATDRFDAVADGKVDLLCGAATATLERRKQVAFSIPIFPSGISALMRADAPERLKALLDGREPPFTPRWRASLAQVLDTRVLSAEKGTTAATWLAERRNQLQVNATVVEVASHEEGIQRVLAGSSAALFGDRPILLEAAARHTSGDQLIVLDRQYTYEPIALASARDDDAFRLVVDRALSRLYRTGKIWSTYTQFFGKPNEATRAFFRFVALPD